MAILGVVNENEVYVDHFTIRIKNPGHSKKMADIERLLLVEV